MYSIVAFPDKEDPTEIVPTLWVDETKIKIKWPPYKQPEKLLAAVRKCIIPEDNGRNMHLLNLYVNVVSYKFF